MKSTSGSQPRVESAILMQLPIRGADRDPRTVRSEASVHRPRQASSAQTAASATALAATTTSGGTDR